MDFQQHQQHQHQQQQQQQLLLAAAALWPPQRAAAIASMLRNSENTAQPMNNTNNNNGNGRPVESVILAQLHQTPPLSAPSTVMRQIIQAPIASGTIRLFDPAQGLPLGASVPETLMANQQQHQQQQQLDQLMMAAAFQQMVERLRGMPPEAKFVPSGDNGMERAPPPNFGSVSNSSSSSSSSAHPPSSFSSSSAPLPPPPPPPPPQIKTELVKKSPPDNAEERDARQTFVPIPTTSADELIGHALGRLVEQMDADGAEADDGNFQEGPSSTDGTSISRTANEEVLLCKVCSDKASGFHYGIFSCEGCKGFFRRSLQNKIDYRPCTQSQKCQIVRASRNRCQECRWRKCIEAGMSKDSVRYGRVPKREKEKLREEMRRDSARSAMEQLGAELEDEKAMVDQLERAFAELGTEMRGKLHFFENSESAEAASPGGPLDARRYLQLAHWVCRFASRIRGFRLLRREERVRLIRDAHFPVLLLRLCTLRRFGSNLSDDKVSNSLLVGLATVPKCLMVPSQNGQFVERIVEFVHRIREAQPPVELCPTDRQLSLIAALCLCRSEGAGEHAAGALSASVPAGGDDHNGHLQLQLAIARRIHERLWQALNATLATDLLPFGPSLLRRDSMERQHLAAMLEALRQLRLAHRQCLASINCCNVPGELFTARNSGLAIADGGNTSPKTRDDSANACGGMPKRRKILVNAAGREDAQKEEHTVATVGDAGGSTVSSNIVYGTTTTAQQQPAQKQLMDDLPNLRRELQRPPANAAAVVGVAVATASSCSGGNANAVTVSPTADVSSTSTSYSQASSLRELLARPPILHVVVPQQQRRLVDATNADGADEQPLNLCVRDHDKRNGREI
uniref:Nuclear receptor domain-containing protein n=1 Tax=Globodera rostochiensis TaxID=31243 RepID=A0A914GWM7_GLORO